MANAAEYLDYAREQRASYKDSDAIVSIVENDDLSEYQKIVKLTSISIKSMSNAYFKSRCYLAINDIDKIKDSLNNFSSDNSKVKVFKAQMIDELSSFQERITMNHVETLRKMRKEKSTLERNAKELEAEKNKIVRERLAKVQWPYTQRTKEIDTTLEKITLQVERYTQRIQEMEELPPIAEEKDLILYQMQFKEKYAI